MGPGRKKKMTSSVDELRVTRQSPVKSVVMALDTVIKRSVDICLIASCCVVLFMALFGSLDVVSTFLFSRPVPLARELSEVLLAVVIFAAMATALREDRNVNVDLFVGRASPFVRRLTRLLALFIGTIVFALLAWRSADLARSSFVENELAAAAIRFPIWPVKIAVTIAMAVTFAEYARQLLWALFGKGRPADKNPSE